MKNTLALSAAAIALLITSLPVHAAYVLDLTQVPDASQPRKFDVVGKGSGTLDITDLFLSLTFQDVVPAIIPNGAQIIIGAVTPTVDLFVAPGGVPFNGPANFGSGGVALASTGSGDMVGTDDPTGLLVLAGYVSGSPLSESMTFDNATFTILGVTPGTYVWTWGSGAHADSFTLQIGIPEPSTWAMMALGFGLLGWVGYWRRRVAIAG
jgi:hypothetical protein